MVLVVSGNVEDKGKQYCESSEEFRRPLLQPQSSAEYRNIKHIERTGDPQLSQLILAGKLFLVRSEIFNWNSYYFDVRSFTHIIYGYELCVSVGTIWTGIAHIITAVIGAGVLSLPWSIGQLGWIGGPIILVAFSGVSLVSSFLISECYRSYLPLPLPKMMIKSAALLDMKGSAEPEEDQISVRNGSYIQAVTRLLGETHGKICGVIVHQTLYGAAIAYKIAASLSIRAIEQANCYHREGQEATCSYTYNYYMLAFGGVQVVMSKIPNFHKMGGAIYFGSCHVLHLRFNRIGSRPSYSHRKRHS